MADRPFSEYEKIFLLAEIIKAGAPNTGTLLNIITQHGIPIRQFDDVVPPPGRTARECAFAFDQIRQLQSQVHYGSYPQTPQPTAAGPAGGQPGNLKRTFESTFSATNRPLQPRPPPSGGATYGQMQATDNPPKKRRGRPPKHEAQAKAQAKAEVEGQGSAGPPPPPFQPVGRLPLAMAPQAPSLPQPVEMRTTNYPPAGGAFSYAPETVSRSTHPPSSRLAVRDLVTPTAPASAPAPASQSSSSSGKRRRGRSTRSNPDNQPASEGAEREASRSPSERFVQTETPDTPARAAVTRYREEQDVSPQQQQQFGPRGHDSRGPSPPARTQDPERG